MYKEVHEHSSTGSTQQEPDCGGVGRKSNFVSEGVRILFGCLVIQVWPDEGYK
ncbi:MAG: hypothetical protein LBL32_00630 [Holosporales bacterium]|nr:hypothetical protein [Holosporales bacterium]